MNPFNSRRSNSRRVCKPCLQTAPAPGRSQQSISIDRDIAYTAISGSQSSPLFFPIFFYCYFFKIILSASTWPSYQTPQHNIVAEPTIMFRYSAKTHHCYTHPLPPPPPALFPTKHDSLPIPSIYHSSTDCTCYYRRENKRVTYTYDLVPATNNHSTPFPLRLSSLRRLFDTR